MFNIALSRNLGAALRRHSERLRRPTKTQGLILAPLTLNVNSKHAGGGLTYLKLALLPERQKELYAILGAASVMTVVRRAESCGKPLLRVYDESNAQKHPRLLVG